MDLEEAIEIVIQAVVKEKFETLGGSQTLEQIQVESDKRIQSRLDAQMEAGVDLG